MRKSRIKYLLMDHLGIRLTTFCNLNCRKCADLLPYQKNCHYDYNLLMEDLNKILGVVDVIHEILLGGGEIFLYPHMNEIIEYCIQSNKIRNVVIVTNGTVIPSEDTLKLLKHKKVTMRVSGYGEDIVPKRPELIQLLKQEEIRLEDLEGMIWREIGNSDCRNRSKKEMEAVWDQCSMNNCITMSSRGRIYYCSHSIAADELECYPSPLENEYVDVRNTPIEDLGEKLEKFYEIGCISTCNYCDGLVKESPIVPTAAQIVQKSIALELLQYEVLLKEGTEDREVISGWLNFVGENYKQFVYEAGFENVLSYTLNTYKTMESNLLDIERKKELTQLWKNFNSGIWEAYRFAVEDTTHRLGAETAGDYEKTDKNTISILVAENQRAAEENMEKADIILTLEDIESKDYSIIEQAF